VSMFVSSLRALSGTHFAVTKLSPAAAAGRLRGQLSVRERETSSMLEIRLQGTDRRDVEARLQGIVDRHMRRNMERRTAEAAQQMEFLEEQLPEQRRALEASEQRYNEFRRDADSIDLRAEDQRLVTEMIEIESELLSIELERSQLRQRLQPNHPQIRQLADRESRLINRRNLLETRLTSLPESQQQLIRLEREIGIDTAIYTQMMNSMQEVRLSRAGLVPTISVVDPVFVGSAQVPSKAMTVGGGGMLGVVLALGIIFGRMLFRRNVEDVQQLEQATGLSVFSVILESRQQTRLDRSSLRSKQRPNLLAAQFPQDPVTESFRSLRTSLHFALLGSRRNILAFTSPEPGVGKSFVTSNLAWLVAESGKKTLLIDADMRRGIINEIFNLAASPGVSDILVDEALIPDSVRSTQLPNLDIITRGTHPPNPSELLMSKNLDLLLDWAEQRYGLIIIDTPPVLPVSDAIIIGTRCGAVLMVTRAHMTTIPLVQHTLKQLQNANVSVAGLLINGLKPKKSSSTLRHYAQHQDYGSYVVASNLADNKWDTRQDLRNKETTKEAAE
jgi:tyrosine-protein kinase Etk/Wzc